MIAKSQPRFPRFRPLRISTKTTALSRVWISHIRHVVSNEGGYPKVITSTKRSRVLFPFPSDPLLLVFELLAPWYVPIDTSQTKKFTQSLRIAFQEAGVRHSGFRYHAALGLVESPDERVHERLQTLAA